MPAEYLLFDEARYRLDEILDYTRDTWGEAQAIKYFEGLLDHCAAIAARETPWRTIPQQFGVEGYFSRYQRHFIYWRVLDIDRVGILTILHERMHQAVRLRRTLED
jgi:toxin ParE1/3/4